MTAHTLTNDQIDHGRAFIFTDPSGKTYRWRRNGKTKRWKTRPDDFKIPVKYGLYDHGYITPDNAAQFTVEE